MPVHNSTYRELYLRQFNLLKFKQDYFALADIAHSFIKDIKNFEGFNKIHLNYLYKKQKELYDKYVETEAVELPDKSIGSRYVFVERDALRIAGTERINPHTGIDGREPKFCSKEAERAFYEEWEELLNIEISITT